MPAKSKEQQRLFGMVHAYQKGELKNPSKEVKDIAKTISKKDAKDFAETKHKGLPNKVKKSVKETVTLSEAQLRKIVAESVKKMLKEYRDGEEGELIPDSGDFYRGNDDVDWGDNPFADNDKYYSQTDANGTKDSVEDVLQNAMWCADMIFVEYKKLGIGELNTPFGGGMIMKNRIEELREYLRQLYRMLENEHK